MTKDWDDVRIETCKLYAEGKSLEYIRKYLRQAKRFEASTRAFRLKIKAWKAKRADAITVAETDEQSHRSISSAPQRALPGSQDMLHRLLDIESVSTMGPTINVSRMRTAEPTKYNPEKAYLQLLKGEEASRILVNCDFSENITNVLHVAARTFRYCGSLDQVPPKQVLEHVLQYVRARNHIDHRDELGDTALSIAIKASEPTLVRSLLEHGASVALSDRHGKSPIHSAVSSKTPLHTSWLLLNYGTDVNAIVQDGHDAKTTLSLLVSILDDRSEGQPLFCIELFETIQRLIYFGASLSSNDIEVAVKAFCCCWFKSPGCSQLLNSAKPILDAYLVSGKDPTKSYEQADETDVDLSLACCAFCDSHDDTLARFLVKRANQMHLPSLISYILGRGKHPPNERQDATDLLKGMLERMSDADYVALASRFAQEALLYAPRSRRLQYLKALAECRPALAYHLVPNDIQEILEALLISDSEALWDPIETLMRPQLEQGASSQLAILMSELISIIVGKAALHEVEQEVISRLWSFSLSVSGSYGLLRPILHVVTKVTVDRFADDAYRPEGMTVERLLDILQLRQKHNLPEVSLTSRTLHKALKMQVSGTGGAMNSP